jgi:hypothetical protein
MGSVTVINTDPRRNLWKEVVIDIFSIITAGLFGYFFARYLAGGFSFWFSLGAIFFWGASSVLQGFLQAKLSRRIGIIALEAVALIAFFYMYAWTLLAAVFFIVVVFLLWGYFAIRRELTNSIELRFFTASSRVIGKVVTAAVIFMVIAYGSLANANGNFFLSEQGFNVFFTWAADFIKNFYPTLPLNGTVGDFAQAMAQLQLQNDSSFQSLPTTEQTSVLQQSATQVVGVIADSTSTTAVATVQSEPASTAFYTYFASLVSKLQDKFNGWFVGIWAIGLFLILRSIGIVVVWASQFVAMIFYEILLASGFMKITDQPATKEVIEY